MYGAQCSQAGLLTTADAAPYEKWHRPCSKMVMCQPQSTDCSAEGLQAEVLAADCAPCCLQAEGEQAEGEQAESGTHTVQLTASPASDSAEPSSECSCRRDASPRRQDAWQSGGPCCSAASSASPEEGVGSCAAAPPTDVRRCRACAAPLTASPVGSPDARVCRMRRSFCTEEACMSGLRR